MTEHDLDDERRRLERKMADFEKEEEQTKREIEAELRQEHWGLDAAAPARVGAAGARGALSWAQCPARISAFRSGFSQLESGCGAIRVGR